MRLRNKILTTLVILAFLTHVTTLYLGNYILSKQLQEVRQEVEEVRESTSYTETHLELLKRLTNDVTSTQGTTIDIIGRVLATIAPYVEPRPAFATLKDANVSISNIFGNTSGSGVIISNGKGYSMVLTAAHVVGDSKFVLVKHGTTLIAGEIAMKNETRDLALLKVFDKIGTALPIASKDANYGEHVYSISNPLHLESVLTEGVLSGTQNVEGREMNVVTLDTMFGSSGGMVTNNTGDLIGIVSRVTMCPIMQVPEFGGDTTEIPWWRKKRAIEKIPYQTTTYNLIVTLKDIEFFLRGLIL